MQAFRSIFKLVGWTGGIIMDAKGIKVIANQKRQTSWLKDYHTNYKKKLEEHRNAVISETEKEKTS